MGHEDVAILNGGLRKWKAEGRPLEDGPARPRQSRHFSPRADLSLVRDKADVSALIGSKATQIVDARSAGRFKGTDPEPRKGLRSGHIPGSRNLPFTTLVNADGTLKPRAEIRAIVAAAGIDLQKPVVATCGSGVTAGVIAFALAQIGAPATAVYDGSWSEWGLEEAGTPVEKG
jgi:thiosulfate/3-mercaptopyruvate sulfurtransferase